MIYLSFELPPVTALVAEGVSSARVLVYTNTRTFVGTELLDRPRTFCPRTESKIHD